MSRARLDYAAPSARVAPAPGFDADAPVAGHYRYRLRSGGVAVGVRIWFGAPLDPVTGEEMDRAHRWQAHVNDAYIDLARVWPGCAAAPITSDEYAFLTRQQRWAEENAPDSAIADPTQRADPLHTPMMF